MAVYVDDMRARYGRMIMCHMMADSTEELIGMARKIGVDPKWIQKEGTFSEHFDIALGKKAKAIEEGAIQVTQMDLGWLMRMRRQGCAHEFREWLENK